MEGLKAQLTRQDFDAYSTLNQLIKTVDFREVQTQLNSLNKALQIEQQAEKQSQQKTLSDALAFTSVITDDMVQQMKSIEKLLRKSGEIQLQAPVLSDSAREM